jgi:hypothetical protein
MYIDLLTTTGERLMTCPAVGGSDAAYVEDSAGADVGKKSAEVSVYPNPVAAGGAIRLKQLELLDGNEDELYTALYLFDAQGKAGRKVVKVAVGQKN